MEEGEDDDLDLEEIIRELEAAGDEEEMTEADGEEGEGQDEPMEEGHDEEESAMEEGEDEEINIDEIIRALRNRWRYRNCVQLFQRSYCLQRQCEQYCVGATDGRPPY